MTTNTTNQTAPEQLSIPTEARPAEAPAPAPTSYFADERSFTTGQRIAQLLASSDLVPQQYRGKIANTVLALEIARQTGSSPFFVMQNLHVIQGRPSWSAQFIIAVLNACGRFKGGLKFEMDNPEKPTGCRAWAIEAATDERVNGPLITLEMAEREGWTTKQGSKWKTMPEVMLRYRAASFFGRLYAPDILLGMHSDDEIRDMGAPPAMNADMSAETNAAPEPAANGAAAINAILEDDHDDHETK